MIFNPLVKHKLISDNFPQFHLAGCKLSFVPNFKYLGHIIDNRLQDDDDVYRELQENSAKLTNQRVSYAFTSSPFSSHVRQI